jgi:chromosome segregation ATPase
MSYAGIQATINFYTMRESDLTEEITSILTDITRASAQTGDFVKQSQEQKNTIRSTYEAGTTEYQVQMDQANEEYAVKLAEISNWEAELEVKKEQLETEIKSVSSYKESFKSALKQNIQKDFKYGGSSS